MLKVGLTGGIGSGKTTVAKVFESFGIPVYYADEAAKRLMTEDNELQAAIINMFGRETYVNGQLNKTFLSQKIFNDAESLQQLNSLVHPAVIKDGSNWLARQTTPYAIKEAALIFESGSAGELDYVIGVYAPQTLRLHRSMQRDGASREEVLARMQKQINETIKMRLCDFVITNDDQQMVIPQVEKIHNQLLSYLK